MSEEPNNGINEQHLVADWEKGAKAQRRRTTRIALSLVGVVVLIISITNVYMMMLLKMTPQHFRSLMTAVSLGAAFLIPVAVILGIRWARPIIHFGEVISSGVKPSMAEIETALKAVVKFPMKLSVMVFIAYQIATLIVAFVLYYFFNFSTWEYGSITLMATMVALNLAVIMYFSTKFLERDRMEQITALLFEAGRYDLEHHRLPLRVKLFLIFLMVVAYILSSSMLMGYAQVERVQRSQLEENLQFTIGEENEGRKAEWDGGTFKLDISGNIIENLNADLSEEEIKQIVSQKEGGIIWNEKIKKMIVFKPLQTAQFITGAIGYWGKLQSAKRETWQLLAVLILATIVLCLVTTFLVVNDINHPIERLLTYLKKTWENEDAKVVTTYSDDEMGMLAGQVFKTTATLKERTRKTKEILEAVNKLGEGLKDALLKVQDAVNEQSAGLKQQVAAVEEALSASSEILATSMQIQESASTVEKASIENNNACTEGKNTIAESLAGFKKLGEFVEEISRSIMGLGEQFEKFKSIVDIIQEIASQVELLALNAQIEAASAGADGKRFGVVATEIGRLSNRTMEAVQQVRELINNVMTSVEKVITHASTGAELVKGGTILADNVGITITGIQQEANKTYELSQGIAIITRQQTTACSQLTDTLKNIHDSAKIISDNTEQVEQSMASLEKLSKNILTILATS